MDRRTAIETILQFCMLNWFKKKSIGSAANSVSEADTKALALEAFKDIPNFEKYKDIILSSLRPTIEIQAVEESKLSLTQSKFGGLPYLPQGTPFPADPQGKPMYLLAQINFKETPRLYPFPSQGILQFYLADSDYYGLDFDRPFKQENWRILYFPEPDIQKAQTDFSFLPSIEYSPFSDNSLKTIDKAENAAYRLEFEMQKMPVIQGNYEFEHYFKDVPEDEEFLEAYYDHYQGEEHRMGGYAYFTQTDPREYKKEYRDKNVLLLQIASQYNKINKKWDIIWGDCGIANFFISEADLLKLDFSNVLYHWDCS